MSRTQKTSKVWLVPVPVIPVRHRGWEVLRDLLATSLDHVQCETLLKGITESPKAGYLSSSLDTHRQPLLTSQVYTIHTQEINPVT